MVLLDTCVLLWIAEGDLGRLSGPALEQLNARPWAVSTLSAWEIGIKCASGKLALKSSPQAWWAEATRFHQLIPLDFTPPMALRAASLPAIHADPFDRGLIATALERTVALVTPDERIRSYASVGVSVVW